VCGEPVEVVVMCTGQGLAVMSVKDVQLSCTVGSGDGR
jgi:hypothetical protein